MNSQSRPSSKRSRMTLLKDRSGTESGGEEYMVYALVAEQVERCLAASRPIDVSEIIAQYPKLEMQIRELVPALAALHKLGPDAPQVVSRGKVRRRTMLGDFVIGEEIGRGGMGVVYKAEQTSLGRPVALKVLPFAAVLDQRQLQRFKNEAQAAAALHHQNIVPVFAVGCERGVHYYAMQYIEGHDLSGAIAQLKNLCKERPPAAADAETRVRAETSTNGFDRGPNFFRTVAELGIQAAEALEFAHQRGIVHRDIKPSNLLLDVERKLWITDFGLAQIESSMSLTGTGDMVGTLRYMSPEQVLGHSSDVDHRSDIFSLGATLYELATLTPVFSAEVPQELMCQRTTQEPTPLRQVDKAVPRDLETIILKSISRRRNDRYATAQEMADDLKRFLAGLPITAQPPSTLTRISLWSRRNRHISWTAGALVMAVLVFIAGLALAPRQPIPDQVVSETQPQTLPILAGSSTEKSTATTTNSPKVVERSQETPVPKATETPAAPKQQDSSQDPVAPLHDEPTKIEPNNVATLVEPSKQPEVAVEEQEEPEADQSQFVLPAETPPPLPQFASESDRDSYVKHLELLLAEGLGQSGASAIQAAEKHAAAARRLTNDDPRLEYALGLVLLKNVRNSPALKQFQVAGKEEDYLYPPARRAEIWCLLLRKDFENGLARMRELADEISHSPADWPDSDTRTVTAYWLGQAIGFLEGPGNSRKVKQALEQQGEFRDRLNESYRDAYDAGRQASHTTHEQLKALAENTRAESVKAGQDRHSRKKEDLAGRLESAEGRQETLKLNTQEWKDWLDDQTNRADEKLAELEKEYVKLEEQAKSLMRSMQQLDFEIQRVTQLLNLDPSTSRFSADNLRTEMEARNTQMLRYQGEYRAIERQANIVNQQARKTTSERQAAVARYEKATGKLVQESKKLQQWSKRLEQQEERLKNRGASVQSPQLTVVRRQIKSLRTYVELDPQREQQRILDSYDVGKSDEKSTDKNDTN